VDQVAMFNQNYDEGFFAVKQKAGDSEQAARRVADGGRGHGVLMQTRRSFLTWLDGQRSHYFQQLAQ